jgi:hypothetical protein
LIGTENLDRQPLGSSSATPKEENKRNAGAQKVAGAARPFHDSSLARRRGGIKESFGEGKLDIRPYPETEGGRVGDDLAVRQCYAAAASVSEPGNWQSNAKS